MFHSCNTRKRGCIRNAGFNMGRKCLIAESCGLNTANRNTGTFNYSRQQASRSNWFDPPAL
jgi:hypothetical protein